MVKQRVKISKVKEVLNNKKVLGFNFNTASIGNNTGITFDSSAIVNTKKTPIAFVLTAHINGSKASAKLKEAIALLDSAESGRFVSANGKDSVTFTYAPVNCTWYTRSLSINGKTYYLYTGQSKIGVAKAPAVISFLATEDKDTDTFFGNFINKTLGEDDITNMLWLLSEGSVTGRRVDSVHVGFNGKDSLIKELAYAKCYLFSTVKATDTEFYLTADEEDNFIVTSIDIEDATMKLTKDPGDLFLILAITKGSTNLVLTLV